MNYDIDFLFVKALQAELYPCNLSGRLFREKVCLRHRENRPTTTDQRPPTGPTTGDRLYKWPLFTSIHKLVVASLQEINSPSYPDMVFIKNLQPQFWENDFTHIETESNLHRNSSNTFRVSNSLTNHCNSLKVTSVM